MVVKLFDNNTSAAQSESYAKIVDSKSPNTAGGSITAGSFITRDLNTVLFDADSIVSLDSNQVTLQAGTYRFSGYTMGHAIGNIKARLRNVTDDENVDISSNGFQSNSGIVSYALFSGRFTISAAKTFEVQMKCSITRSSNGLGLQGNLGENERYTELEIWKEF